MAINSSSFMQKEIERISKQQQQLIIPKSTVSAMDFYEKKVQVVPRPKPMKVLILGLPRTGTTCKSNPGPAKDSLYKLILGLQPYAQL
jgi:hypothetical protein